MFAVSSPRQNRNVRPLSEIRAGFAAAYTGLNPSTVSVKADFPFNGLAPGAELKDRGSFVAPGVFSIPLQAPIAKLGVSHVTAAIADRQGNTNVVKVRFWVDTGFRVVSWDASALANRRLTVRIENPNASSNHTVLATQDLAKPTSQWIRLKVLDAADEANSVRRIEVELPDDVPGNFFLRLQQP